MNVLSLKCNIICILHVYYSTRAYNLIFRPAGLPQSVCYYRLLFIRRDPSMISAKRVKAIDFYTPMWVFEIKFSTHTMKILMLSTMGIVFERVEWLRKNLFIASSVGRCDFIHNFIVVCH